MATEFSKAILTPSGFSLRFRNEFALLILRKMRGLSVQIHYDLEMNLRYLFFVR